MQAFDAENIDGKDEYARNQRAHNKFTEVLQKPNPLISQMRDAAGQPLKSGN